MALGLGRKQLGEDVAFQHGKGLGIAKKIGHANQQVAKQRVDFRRCVLQILDVRVDVVHALHRHAPLDAPVNRAGFVLRKIVPGLGTQQYKDFFQGALHVGCGGEVGGRQFAKGVRYIGHELGGHLWRGQLVVDQPGGDGTGGHAVKLARRGALHHHHATRVLDGAQPQRAIAAGARKHDAHRPLALVFCQRLEQVVNRQSQPTRSNGVQQVQRALQKGHVVVGRNDVDAIGLHHHTVFHFKHLHAGVAANQVGQHAFVVGRKVLHQHKGHARVPVGGHAGKESLKRRQATGGGTDTDNGERNRRRRSDRIGGQSGQSGRRGRGYSAVGGGRFFVLAAVFHANLS